MSLIQKTGACIYCGQIGTVEAEEHISVEEIDKMVSLQCDCHLAKEAVKKAQRLEKAKDSAKKLFADHSEDVIYFMQAAVTLISNGEIGQIKIDTIGNVKFLCTGIEAAAKYSVLFGKNTNNPSFKSST